MSEEQTKPSKKWHNKRFIILALLVFIVILMLVVFMYIMTAGTVPTPTSKSRYNADKIDLEFAITDYQEKNSGELPALNALIDIDGNVYHIVNICKFLRKL